MEIKVGDKVRVSKDAPIHIIGSASEIECKAVVLGTDADIAVIGFRTQEKQRYDAYKVPTKYLTKVEDEAKAKYKVGDKVRVLGHALLEGGVFTITLVEHREKRGWMYRINTHTWYPESDLEPYAEPTELVQPKEQTEAEKTDTDNIVDNFTKVMEGYSKVFANIADNFDWQRYEADLAKEIAVKLSKPNENKPGYVADYAVSVAKAVVENLKKK